MSHDNSDPEPNNDSVTEVTDTSDPYHQAAYRNYALGLLTVVYAFNFIDRQLLAILQESIKLELGLSDSQLGLLTGFAFAVFYVTAGIPIARLADRWVRRNIVAMAIGTWSLMTALSGLAGNYTQLLAARIGVGVGEAGGSPPAHSMLSDIFPPHQRATALSFYSTGINIGILFGFLLGGWLNEFFGWRVAFMVVGLPGLAIAVLVRVTLAEPARGFSERIASADQQASSLREVLALLWSRRSFRYLSLGAALSAMVGYGAASWSAPFFIRSHGMGTGELGMWLALGSGVFGALGTFSTGYLADKFGKRDKRWYMWLPAAATFLVIPFSLVFLTTDSKLTALLLQLVPGFLLSAYIGPCLAMTHGLVGLRMRATASAILFFVLNLIGLGLGPLVIGVLSDALAPSYAVESLRYAMLYTMPATGVLCGLLYLLSAKYLREDLANAPR